MLHLAALLAALGGLPAPPREAPSERAEGLRRHVEALAGAPRPRVHHDARGTRAAREYVEARFRETGLAVSRQEFRARGRPYANVVGRLNAGKGRLVVVGAHYDVCGPLPGADDNASGVAGLIELARALGPRAAELPFEVQFVAYANEEPPFFATEDMGSMVHARGLKAAGADLEVAVVLEMIGYYSDAEGSQRYPAPALAKLYPSRGNFIAAVSDPASRAWGERMREAFRATSRLPCEALAAPASLTGVDFSDHRSYWALGYRALMLTDTAFYRNPHYHEASDLPGTLDYVRMAQVVQGLEAFLLGLEG